MRGAVGWRFTGVAFAILPLPAVAEPAARVYVVERLGDAIAADDSIGRKRAGLACIPNGQLRWRDLLSSDRADRREIVEDALEDGGLPILATAGSATRKQYRIRGLITEAAANLCAHKILIGDSSALAGTARVTVEWRIEDIAAPAIARRHVSTIDKTYAQKDAASAGTIGRALITDAARDLAAWLKTEPAAD